MQVVFTKKMGYESSSTNANMANFPDIRKGNGGKKRPENDSPV